MTRDDDQPIRDDDHPNRWCPDCGRWIEEPCEHERNDETGDGYPAGWPRCAAGCGRPALDGHMTCGLAGCNEGSFR